MAYQKSTGALRRLQPRIQQYEATHGRKVHPQLLESWIAGELAAESEKAIQSRSLDITEERYNKLELLSRRELDLSERKLGLYEQQLEDEKGAATVAGIGELATGAGALYQSGILSGLLPSSTVPTAASVATGAGEVAGAGVSAGLGAEAGGSLLSTALLPAAAGVGAGFLGQKLTKAGEPGHEGGEVTTGRAIGGVGGAALGFKIGAVGGPVTSAIGAIIGGVIGLFTGGGK